MTPLDHGDAAPSWRLAALFLLPGAALLGLSGLIVTGVWAAEKGSELWNAAMERWEVEHA